MVAVLLDAVTVRFASETALEALTLRVEEGEAVALLGPSGSGKTTVLRALAGLTDPESGDVMFDLRRMNDVPTHDRNLAMVFQDNVLFPNMNVRRNVGFPLSVRKRPVKEIASRVEAETRAAGIANLLGRDPNQLSAGQQQIVQIARAMVRRPDLLLVDEPFARLDPMGSDRLRSELRLVQSGYGVTAIYATHNYVDAMGLADRIAVLEEGRIRQVGTSSEVYDEPADMFVAGFIGTPQMSFLEGVRARGGVEVGDMFVSAPAPIPSKPVLGVRPEGWTIGDSGLSGVVSKSYPLGPDFYVIVDTDAGRTTIRLKEERLETGTQVHLRPWRYHIFNRVSEKAVYHSSH